MKSLLLICALGLSHADCTIDTASAVIQGPLASGLAQCGFLSQAYLADTAIAGYLDDAHYLKITCSPETVAIAGAKPPTRSATALAR